jgi:hypothetical protein
VQTSFLTAGSRTGYGCPVAARRKAKETQVALRVDEDTLARAQALAGRMARRSPDLAAFRLTRAAVLRMALLRGLAELEGEHPAGPGSGGGRR